jgi:hypothetical protein
VANNFGDDLCGESTGGGGTPQPRCESNGC